MQGEKEGNIEDHHTDLRAGCPEVFFLQSDAPYQNLVSAGVSPPAHAQGGQRFVDNVQGERPCCVQDGLQSTAVHTPWCPVPVDKK